MIGPNIVLAFAWGFAVGYIVGRNHEWKDVVAVKSILKSYKITCVKCQSNDLFFEVL